MSLSRFARMVANKEIPAVRAIIMNYKNVVSTSVHPIGGIAKVLGIVMHISKFKKMTYSGKIGEKKIKKEIAYYRMVFCREYGQGGNIFVIIFDATQKTEFQLSNFEIGQGTCTINPTAEGVWMNAPVLRSASPCIRWECETFDHQPTPFPDSGFVAFCFSSCKVAVIDIGTVRTCSGTLCSGLYGGKPCPCVITSTLPKMTLTINILVDEQNIRLETFSSIQLTKRFIDLELLENMTMVNDNENIYKVFEHVEKQMNDAKWTIHGWWKASTVDDAATYVPKGHIVTMIPEKNVALFILEDANQ